MSSAYQQHMEHVHRVADNSQLHVYRKKQLQVAAYSVYRFDAFLLQKPQYLIYWLQ